MIKVSKQENPLGFSENHRIQWDYTNMKRLYQSSQYIFNVSANVPDTVLNIIQVVVNRK